MDKRILQKTTSGVSDCYFLITIDLSGISTTEPLSQTFWKQSQWIGNGSATDQTKPAYNDYRLSKVSIMAFNANDEALKRVPESLKASYMGYGVVRLYREYESSDEFHGKEIEAESDDTTVAIVAVPTYFSPTDVLAFIGETAMRDVSHFRLVRSENPNHFMVLVKFRTRESARMFRDDYNGKPFNSMESEHCHVIFIKSVIFRPLNTPNITGIPYLLEDPFTLQVKKSKPDQLFGAGSVVKELPTCPVCLERMDSDVSGLVTISCQHTFHCNCLSKWRDDTCPVCRYSNLSLDPLRRSDSKDAIQCCSSCGSTQNLWICLICGNIGCGRYNSKHAIEHYEATMHCFSMDINTQRVWDYAGDNYVHRLLQNESDGKLVELPGASSSSSLSENVYASTDDLKDKNRDYSIEYSNVLLSQLESQREYYESRLAEAADLSAQAISERQSLEERLEQLEKKVGQLSVTSGPSKVMNDNSGYIKEVKVAKKLAHMFEQKWKEEQALTQSISENLEKLKFDNEKLAKSNAGLQEELNDLMCHLSTQARFENAPEELKNGQIVIQQAHPQHRANRHSGKKR